MRRWAAILCLLAGCGTTPPPADPTEGMPRPVVVCLGYADTESGPASLAALRPGRVVQVHVREGQTVAAGALLVSLDDAEAKAGVEQARSRLKGAEARLALAKQEEAAHPRRLARLRAEVTAAGSRLAAASITLKRLEDLESRNLGNRDEARAQREQVKAAEAGVTAAKSALDEATAANPKLPVDAVAAEVEAMRAGLTAASAAQETYAIKAPSAGTILTLGTRAGETTGQPGMPPAVQFAPEGGLIVRAEVEQELSALMKVGRECVIRDELGGGVAVTGRVERVGTHFVRRRHRTDPTQFVDVPTVECLIRPGRTDTGWRVGQKLRVAVYE